MAHPEATEAVERVVYIEARPETVYSFLIDPQKLVRWKGVSAQLDPQPGGIYRVEITGTQVVRDEYVETTPYSRVVFTWGWEGEGSLVPPGSSTVEISLTADGDGTLVRLRHLGLTTAEQRELHTVGWDHFLQRLVVVAGGGDPGPDPWAQAPTSA